MDIDRLIKKAIDQGFTKAIALKDIDLKANQKFRDYCAQGNCPKYGLNWVCPPGCGTLEESQNQMSQYSKGVILTSFTRLNPPTEKEEYEKLNKQHNMRLKAWLEETNASFNKVLALTSGGCIFCEKCAFPSPCIKPASKMNSLSAYGVDVKALCESVNLEFGFNKEKVQFIALVLYK